MRLIDNAPRTLLSSRTLVEPITRVKGQNIESDSL
jgi:hypothetical protein